jgi:hypothetical protein
VEREDRIRVIRNVMAERSIELSDEVVAVIADHECEATREAVEMLVFEVAGWIGLRGLPMTAESARQALLPADELLAMEYAEQEMTPLLLAVEDADAEEVATLLRDGPDLETTTKKHAGMTPLLLACFQRDAPTVELLLRAGADPNNRGRYDAPPLHEGVATASVVRLLLEAGADPNAVSDGGETGLMTAARKDRNLAQVELLLDAGADASRVDREGRTALAIAEECGAEKIAPLLRARGAAG